MNLLSLLRCALLTTALLSAAPSAVGDQGKVTLEGVSGEVRKNLLARLSLDKQACDAADWQLQGGIKSATGEIRTGLEAFGYYQPVITPQFKPADKNGCWEATFTIQPGSRVTLRTVDVDIQGEAANDTAFTELLRKSKLQAGRPLRHDEYESLKAGISNLAAARGYFDSRFTQHELRVDPAAGYADVHLHFDSGVRFRFGATQSDQDVIDPALLQRYLAFHSGEPYSRKALTESSRALSSSGYFGQVLVEPLIEAADHQQVPVRISLTPADRHRYTGSVGYATDTGPRLGLGYKNQRINRRGHQFTSDLSLSRVISKLTLGYSIPLKNPVTDKLTYEAGYKHEVTDSFRADATALSATWAHQLKTEWLEERSLVFGREDYKIGNDDKTTSLLLMPGIGWSKSVADDRLYPRKGYRLSFKTRGGLKQVVSDVSFLQLIGEAKGVLGLPWRSRLIGRANAGVTFMNEFDQLPVSVRFFAGGDNSVRGYAYKSLGPENADGEVEGGKNLLVGSLEIEHLVTAKWGLSAFVDSGNAFDNTSVDPKTGVGVGINWRSPVGPIRIDFAHPLDKHGDRIRIHFIMGPDL